MGNVKDKSYRENKNTFFVQYFFFRPKIVPFINVEKYCMAQQYTWQYNTAHALCMLGN